MPHQQQVNENAPHALQEALFDRCSGLAGVVVGRSHVSVPGACAFHLAAEQAQGQPAAFMAETEFAHLHPPHDGSLHLMLPEVQARAVIDAGWGEFHPLVIAGVLPPTQLMVFGPRDSHELEVVWRIIRALYSAATGG